MKAEIPYRFNKIQAPDTATHADLIVANLVNEHGNVWRRSAFSIFKKRVRDYLRTAQKGHCCYCRRLLRFDKGAVQIEHVLDKKSYPEFMFELQNLVLSCTDCNNGKSTTNVLRSPQKRLSKYPRSGEPFLWVHPYFHTYSAHIGIEKGWVYYPKNASARGAHTITTCKLDQLERIEKQNLIARIGAAEDRVTAIGILTAEAKNIDIAEIPEIQEKLQNLFKKPYDLQAKKEIDELVERIEKKNISKVN